MPSAPCDLCFLNEKIYSRSITFVPIWLITVKKIENFVKYIQLTSFAIRKLTYCTQMGSIDYLPSILSTENN